MQIKEKPEDFIVKENIALDIVPQPHKYAIYSLTKRQTNTIQAIDILTKKLGLQKRDIGFAGIKDKHAITTQYISLPNLPKTSLDKVLACNSDFLTLEFLGYAPRSIGTDILVGNTFTLRVTDIRPHPCTHVINYFGEQRFSIDNAQIGKFLVQRNFKEAASRIAGSAKTHNEKLVSAHLHEHPNDYIGALRTLPRQTATLFVHAYQSLLWNRTIARLLNLESESKSDNYIAIPRDWNDSYLAQLPEKIPLIGFFYEPKDWSPIVQEQISAIMQAEGISPRDFIIRQWGEIAEIGAIRATCISLTDLELTELGANEWRIAFSLPKGSYATVALRFLANVTEK